MKSPHKVIIRPLLTEKVTKLQEESNQYAFEVAPDANKIEIRHAIETLWPVRVLKVRTQVVRGKTVVRSTRSGRFEGRKKNWKKAIVTLAEGDTIEFFEGAV